MESKTYYSELRVQLSDGEQFVALWPKDISEAMLQEIKEIFDFQMGIVAKMVERRKLASNGGA